MSAARARSQRVLRCDCGQFVRLDRNLSAPPREASAPSEPPGPPDLADAFDDEVTHMVSSLEEVKALSAASRAREVRASLYDRDEDDAATRVAPSTSETSRPSTPPPRNTPPPRRPSSPVQHAVSAATDKPLWYVDLGGAETVEMTIEQVILARRSGKLGEGALVWRAGMPDWRPVGTLIPASSSPSNPAPPPKEPASNGKALGTYDRPVPTLEFALEKPAASLAAEVETKTPAPVRVRSSAPPPPRPPTPIPRVPVPTRSHSQVGPLPAPAPLPAPRTPTPIPPAPPAAVAAPASVAPQSSPPPRPVVGAMPLLGRASPTPPAEPAMLGGLHYPWHGDRPRWASIAIAVAVCIAASGSGAFLVRALKLRRQPLSLATTQLSATTFAATPAPPALTAASEPTPTATTTVVDVSSLSVEPRAPRPRAALLPPALPISAPAPAKPAENSGLEDPAIEPSPTPKKAKSSDLPPAAHSNPYTTGTVDDATAKKAPGSDEPGF